MLTLKFLHRFNCRNRFTRRHYEMLDAGSIEDSRRVENSNADSPLLAGVRFFTSVRYYSSRSFNKWLFDVDFALSETSRCSLHVLKCVLWHVTSRNVGRGFIKLSYS